MPASSHPNSGMAHTCVTYTFACITKNGLRAFARDAFGLSKKSLTSANVACLNLAPPYSLPPFAHQPQSQSIVHSLEPKGLRCMCQCSHDPRMQGLHLLQACRQELALRRRALIDTDPHEDLPKERKDAGDVVEPGNNRCFAMWLGEIRARSDTESR